MNSKIKEYFENKENRIKCGITGGTIALAVVIFTVMVFMEKNETPNNPTETVSQTESDTQTEEAAGYSFNAGDLYDMRLDAQTIEDYYMKSCGDQFNLYTIDEDGVLWGSGHNEYAQIGLGYADEEFHEKKSKIAEHVVHVDYSQKDFVVYLTEEGNFMVLETILPICYCSIQKCQWKIWHIRQNGMSPVRHFCWKMSVMRGADVMM